MAAAKDTAPTETKPVDPELEDLRRRNEELAAQLAQAQARQAGANAAPGPMPVILKMPTGAEQSAIASEVTADRAKATELLNKGCPSCKQPIRVYDFPAYVHGHPMLWPTLVFHYRTNHPGLEIPAPPDPEDAKVFDARVEIIDDGSWGAGPGKKVAVLYKELFERAVVQWNAGVR